MAKTPTTKKQLIAEHKKIVKVLTKKDPKELEKEKKKQKKELEEYKKGK